MSETDPETAYHRRVVEFLVLGQALTDSPAPPDLAPLQVRIEGLVNWIDANAMVDILEDGTKRIALVTRH